MHLFNGYSKEYSSVDYCHTKDDLLTQIRGDRTVKTMLPPSCVIYSQSASEFSNSVDF
ncbi:hypothetical protein HCG51_02690 [Tolypothrix sp. PCC 7910]|uniref:hypothetical protein n=1 Tax=Tolypothrix sp. PCC 7910 TaxID=2099387 RepID=UPI0014277E4F|nr:hypothetical protein [Tolypothrix sp. PCC 7910]QIR35765.1 hypothetical protein HCG51_02690 [Tolypothrix sp. PCC 7910]